MATLEAALPTIFRQEGLLSDNKKDPGGITNYGISLRFLLKTGDLDKDGIPDGDIDGDGDIDTNDIRLMVPHKAARIYDLYFWRPNRYSSFNSQIIATKAISLCINMIWGGANRCLQRAINESIKKLDITNLRMVVADGINGNKTIDACNTISAIDEQVLLDQFKLKAAAYYKSIIYKGSEDFLTGWLNRAYD